MQIEYIKNFRRNLNCIIKLIQKYKIPIETISLVNLENSIPYNFNSQNDDVFTIDISELTININHNLSSCYPNDIKEYVISFDHILNVNSTRNIETHDVIDQDYKFEIIIMGYNSIGDDFSYGWHLDKNIESSEPNLTHPYYHFQGWNDNLNHILEEPSYGKVLLMGTPRFPHPPMDLFLGLHFIINNFIKSDECKEKKNFLNDIEYQRIIISSQQVLWDNYFKSYSNTTHSDFNLLNVFPLYLHQY